MGMRAYAQTLPCFQILSIHNFDSILVGSFTSSPANHLNLLFIPSIPNSSSPALCFSTSPTTGFASQPAHKNSASSPLSKKDSIETFLQKSCGLSQRLAEKASEKLVHLKSTKNPKQVLKFFKERGFSDSHIQTLISRRPEVLASSVPRTLQHKLRLFENLGMVGNMLGDAVSRDPTIFKRSIKGKLLPGISFLQEVLQTNENVVKVLSRQPWLLHFDLEKTLKPKILFLKNYGIDEKRLWNHFVSQPRFLISSETVIKNVLKTAEELGVPRQSDMFVDAVFAVSSMAMKTLQRKLKFFIRSGLSEKYLLTAFQRSPYILTVSEEKFKQRMDFLVNTLKYEPSIIAQYPGFLMWSMESRILPRYRVLQLLQSMKLWKKRFSVIEMFLMSEKIFFEKFIFRYGPFSGLYESYKGIDVSVPVLDVDLKVGEMKDTGVHRDLDQLRYMKPSQDYRRLNHRRVRAHVLLEIEAHRGSFNKKASILIQFQGACGFQKLVSCIGIVVMKFILLDFLSEGGLLRLGTRRSTPKAKPKLLDSRMPVAHLRRALPYLVDDQRLGLKDAKLALTLVESSMPPPTASSSTLYRCSILPRAISIWRTSQSSYLRIECRFFGSNSWALQVFAISIAHQSSSDCLTLGDLLGFFSTQLLKGNCFSLNNLFFLSHLFPNHHN
eukprot:Gb_25286 [translate_table: standard]